MEHRFSDVNILQGSVAKLFRWSGILVRHFVAN